MKPVPLARARRRQGGAFAIMFGIMLVAIIGFFGLALDVSHMYVRRTEMQNVADAAALAAALEFDGTEAGAARALARAANVVTSNRYGFNQPLAWSPTALSFGATPNAPESDWVAASAVTSGNAAALRFVRIDTTKLDGAPGAVALIFLRAMSSTLSDTIETGARAVAGRIASQVAPLAICAIDAMVPLKGVERGLGSNLELVEYGFRRGVGYNLLALNPTGSTPLNFMINPVDFPGRPDDAAHTTMAAMRPYVCGGSIHAARVTGSNTLYVSSPFPSALISELNTRLGNDPGVSICNPVYAGPDRNIKSLAGGGWMTPAPTRISAKSVATVAPDTLLTVADMGGTAAATSSDYGVLWSFARAVKYSASSATGVGGEFSRANWDKLYPALDGSTLASSNETILPYFRSFGSYFQAPGTPLIGMPKRRVLNVALLSCPVSGSTASVLGIGQFMMTAAADPAIPAVYAEFGGLVSEASVSASVALFK
jgi:Flp pilus assembly protein TadG